MRLKDLTPELLEKAKVNIENEGRVMDLEEELIFAFAWKMSNEGHDFWSKIYHNAN